MNDYAYDYDITIERVELQTAFRVVLIYLMAIIVAA